MSVQDHRSVLHLCPVLLQQSLLQEPPTALTCLVFSCFCISSLILRRQQNYCLLCRLPLLLPLLSPLCCLFLFAFLFLSQLMTTNTQMVSLFLCLCPQSVPTARHQPAVHLMSSSECLCRRVQRRLLCSDLPSPATCVQMFTSPAVLLVCRCAPGH